MSSLRLTWRHEIDVEHRSQKNLWLSHLKTKWSIRSILCLLLDLYDRHEELFYEEEKQAMEMQSRKMLEEIERCKIEVLKEEERALEEIRKLQGSFKLREELAQKEAMVNAYVKIEKEERASHFGEDEFDIPAEDGRSEQMDRFLRDLPELKPAVPPLLPK